LKISKKHARRVLRLSQRRLDPASRRFAEGLVVGLAMSAVLWVIIICCIIFW
jgi:hypothetical protein